MRLTPVKELSVQQPFVGLGDPHVWSDARDLLSIRYAVYESLVQYDDQGEYRPALAQNWTVEEDAQTWFFDLRPGVSFHNGDKLTARDVVATFERACTPEMAGEMGTQGLYARYLSGTKFETQGEHRVKLVTSEPMADLLDLLVRLPIVPQRSLVGLFDNPVGSGPYRVLSADRDHIVMTGFKGHWGGRPPVDKLYWRAEPDSERRVSALLAREADIVTDIGLEGKTCIESTAQADVIAKDSSLCVIFMCNAQSGVCADRRVRQALNYGLDVGRIIEDVKGNAAQPLNGPLTSSHFGYDPATPVYPYDPVKARALLADAGYVDSLEIAVDIPAIHPDEAPLLARHLAEQYAAIGIKTTVKSFNDRPAYAEMVKAKEIDDICCFDSSPLSTFRCLREKLYSDQVGPWWQGYVNTKVA